MPWSRLGLTFLLAACGASTAAPVATPPAAGATTAPPQSEANVTPAAADVYAAWLQAQGADGANVREATLAPPSPWRFFYSARAPGDKQHPAAVRDGTVVHINASAGWDALLRDGSTEQATQRLAWLLGAATPLAPDTAPWRRLTPEASAVVTPPRRTVLASGVDYEAWFADPPSFTPYRVRIVTTPSTTTQTRTPLHRVLAEAPPSPTP